MSIFKVSKLGNLKTIRTATIILLIPIIIVAVISFLYSIFYKPSLSIQLEISKKQVVDSRFYEGIDVGVMFSALSTLLLIYTIIDQFIEKQKSSATETFYKMVEFHNNIVYQLSVAHIDVSKKESMAEEHL